ncbi:hypothetical protein MKY95_23305 [Paenibacillus sp. FSL P4-0176]|uniref:hypothetical protein n=1 Tax=Paenibacillus sp. FSL P4-0176 TaxID=2921631 RepID=UPI0030D47929
MRYLKCIAPCRYFTAGELYPVIHETDQSLTLIDNNEESHNLTKGSMFTQTSFGEEEQS